MKNIIRNIVFAIFSFAISYFIIFLFIFGITGTTDSDNWNWFTKIIQALSTGFLCSYIFYYLYINKE